MAVPKTLLVAVHHISEHSILFLPSRSSTLDLKTLSTAPPCHRAVLQRNGLVAKVYATLTFTDETDEGSNGQREVLSLSGRQDMWCSALAYAGLLGDKDTPLAVPDNLQTTPWPCLTLTQYRDYVKQTAERATCTAVNNSSFCVPILSLQEYVYKRYDVEVSLAVVWMPFYPCSLRQWATNFEAAGKRIPEASLLAMLHHMAIAQLTVRSADTIAGRSEEAAAASTPCVDAILVHPTEKEREGRTGDWSEEPTFVLSASASDEECRVALIVDAQRSNNEREASPTSPTDSARQQRALYRPPEECSPRLYPTLVVGSMKRAVWGLGVVLYLLASGQANLPTPPDGRATSNGNTNTNGHNCTSATTGSPRRARTVEEVPLNAASMTPDGLWKRLRRDFERRGYSSTLTTVAAQLLSLDPLTRPSLTTVDRMLQDLHRPTPIHRFPFALGAYDLLRLPNPSSTVALNPGARRYTFAEVCVLCKKPRSSITVCSKGGDHQAAGITSPSWNDESALVASVGLASAENTYVTFLYPLCGAANGRQRRKQTAHALQTANASMSVMISANASGNNTPPDVVPLHCGLLLQVFGGFAVYERHPQQSAKGHVFHAAKVREVLIPYPSQGLRRSELSLVKTTLEFSGGLPWPSCCTETLQKSGRTSRHVPFALTGSQHDVEWFGWVLPGERFAMPNGGHWTAPQDGAFVFWFGQDLQPTDRDRYFAVTSVRAATLPAKVPRTLLPDSLFRQHVGDESQMSTLLMRSVASSVASRSESQCSPRSPAANAARRRSTQSVTDIILPVATREIVEVEGQQQDEGITEQDDVVLQDSLSRPASRLTGTDDTRKPRSTTRRRRASATRPRRSASCQVSVVAAPTSCTATAMDDRTAAPTRNHNSSSHRNEEATQRRSRCSTDVAPSVKGAGSPSPVPGPLSACAPAAAARNDGFRKASNTPSTPPPPALPQPQCRTPEPHTRTKENRSPTTASAAADQDSTNVLNTARSPKCNTPAAWGRISSRENTQPQSHRDSSAKNMRALAPLPLNEAVRRSPRVSAREGKTRKSRMMVATEAPRSPAASDGTESINTLLTPLHNERNHTSCCCPNRGGREGGGQHRVADAASTQRTAVPQGAKQTLSPRPSRWLVSPQVSAASLEQQQTSGMTTPTFATPKLAPLSHAVSALSTLRVCGLWLPAEVVDATFQGLTFWVFSTGEHGYMQPPIKMSVQMGYGLRAPPEAVYIAFLSNQVPLFRRNHPRMDVAVFCPLLPHHGFACYNADGKLLGVLALRFSMKDDADVLHGEFTLVTHVREACHGSQLCSRALYASFLTGSVGDEKAMLGEKAGNRTHATTTDKWSNMAKHTGQEAELVMPQLLHSRSFTQTGMDSRTLWRTPSEAQTLTFTSACHLVGEFTPNDKEDFASHKESAPVLPACWVGFDAASGCLLFTDVGQAAWVPYSIGD